MLTLKLQRVGKKHQGSFRLVVGEKREKIDGRQLEDLGWYNPRTDKFEVKKERVLHWIKNGAQQTDSVHNLLITAGVTMGKKTAVHKQPKKSEEEKKAAEAKAAAALVEKPAEKKEEAPSA